MGVACRGPTGTDQVLSVAPAAASLFVADTARFTATLRDRDGTVVPATPVWTSSDTAVARVDQGGLVTAQAPGDVLIRATVGALMAEAALAVSADSGQVIAIAPPQLVLMRGDSGRLEATVRNRNGDVIPAMVQWTTSDAAVARVSELGWVRAVAGGTARVRATAAGLSAEALVTVIVPSGTSATLVAAGDIASCDFDGDEATAELLDDISGTVLALGDNVYEDGTLEEFNTCYDPTWGRHKGRTRPVPGNHEYQTGGAAGYFAYFGGAAGESPRGYYSYTVGDWHIIALNSNISMAAGSDQEVWLRAELAANRAVCTLAYWHHPLFSSGLLGSERSRPIWQALHDANADVVLVGHEHNYERFAPQNAQGERDVARGLRQFTVGTGGAGLHGFGPNPAANSEVRDRSTYGVLKLTLFTDRYEWEFVPAAGGSFRDSGSARCH